MPVREYPKKFDIWFDQYGMLDDGWDSLEPWQRARIKSIAYRAFRRGQQDKSAQAARNVKNAFTTKRV